VLIINYLYILYYFGYFLFQWICWGSESFWAAILTLLVIIEHNSKNNSINNVQQRTTTATKRTTITTNEKMIIIIIIKMKTLKRISEFQILKLDAKNLNFEIKFKRCLNFQPFVYKAEFIWHACMEFLKSSIFLFFCCHYF